MVSEVRTAVGLLALQADWEDLFDDLTSPTPFASWEWTFFWRRHLSQEALSGRPQRALRVLCVRDGAGCLIAIAPCHGWGPGAPRFGSRELRQIGDAGRDGEGMTDEPALLLRRGRESEAVQVLLTYLTADTHERPDYFKLRLQSPQPLLPCGPEFWRHWARRSWITAKRTDGSETVILPADWPAFRHSLSRSMRDNLSYYPRRLARHGHSYAVELVRDPAQVCAAIGLLTDLHNRRAQSRRGCGHLSHIPTEAHEQFLRMCLPSLAAQRRAFIGLLRIDGKVAAAQAFLEVGNTLTFYYSGHDDSWYDYSPLTILSAHVLQDAIARGVSEANFLPGPAPWKARWGASSKTSIEEVTALNTATGPLSRVLLRSARRTLGQWQWGKNGNGRKIAAL